MLQGISVSYLSWLRSTVGWSLGRMTTSQFCQLYVRPTASAPPPLPHRSGIKML